MDRHRQIAFIAAFIVALVIMMVGKACTDKMFKTRPVQNSTSQSTPSYDYNSYNNYNNSYNNNNYSYNDTPQQTEAPVQTEPSVEYVTNMFGEVIGTAEPVVTEVPEMDVTEIQTTTQQRSILEQYNENKNNANNPDSY
ncbi:MAG: hypothetical protein K2J40_06520 [Ruminococcus sp.]|nr:hypothetical protein [Ruminococcus sp.]